MNKQGLIPNQFIVRPIIRIVLQNACQRKATKASLTLPCSNILSTLPNKRTSRVIGVYFYLGYVLLNYYIKFRTSRKIMNYMACVHVLLFGRV